jgi:hypothetical protein
MVDIACSTGRNREMPEETLPFFFQTNINFAMGFFLLSSTSPRVLFNNLKIVVMIFLDRVKQNKLCDFISISTLTIIN